MPIKQWGSEPDPKPDIKNSFVSWDVYETRHTDANLAFKAQVLEKCGLGLMIPLIETLIRYSLENCFCPYDIKMLNSTDFALHICVYNDKGVAELKRLWFLASEQLPYQISLTYEPHRIDMYFILLPAQYIPLERQVSYPEVRKRIGKIVEQFSKH